MTQPAIRQRFGAPFRLAVAMVQITMVLYLMALM